MHLMSTTSSLSNTSGSSLGPCTPVNKSCNVIQPDRARSNRHRTRSTPHGPLTLHKIARIKMLDRHSCYVAGIQREIATKEILSKPEFFGQFGEISSIRVLRDRDPGEVYLRFHSEKDARRAIVWCNSQSPLGISAQHGYQKYCIKFIDNKRCKRPNCPHRHSWCDNRDIIPSAAAMAQAHQNNPIAPEQKSLNEYLRQKNIQSKGGEAANVLPPQGAGYVLMRNQFADLKRQFLAQREMMKSIALSVKQLQEENSRLRMENQLLSLVPGPNHLNASGCGNGMNVQPPFVESRSLTPQSQSDLALNFDLDLNFNVDFDEGLVDEIVQDVFRG